MNVSNVLARVGTVCLVVGISACASYSPSEQAPAPTQPAETVTPEPQVVAPAPGRSEVPAAGTDQNVIAAYTPLIQKADTAAARGDYEQALALLERAQRIDPDSPAVYLALARTHSQRGDTAQSRANAERGLLYCVEPQQCEQLRAYAR